MKNLGAAVRAGLLRYRAPHPGAWIKARAVAALRQRAGALPALHQAVRGARESRSRIRTLTSTAVLGVLVAVNVVVAGLVLRTPSTGGSSAVWRLPTVPTPSPGGASPAARRDVPRPQTAAAPDLQPGVEPPLDSGYGILLRAEPGGCGTGRASLYRSDDGGGTWQTIATPASVIMRVRVVDRDHAWFVGADRSCQPRMYSTEDGGRTWQPRPSTDGAWYRLPDPGARSLHAPDRVVDSPCRRPAHVREVAALTLRRAAVLCADGSVYNTSDTALSWQRAGSLPGARAIDFPLPQVGFGAATADGCRGLEISGTADGGRSWQPLSCVPADPAEPAALDFTTAAEGVLEVGTDVLTTSDGGHTWRPAAGAPVGKAQRFD